MAEGSRSRSCCQKRQADNTLRADLVDGDRSRVALRRTPRRSRTAGHGVDRCSRTVRRPKRSTCWSSARATRRRDAEVPRATCKRLVPALFAEEPFKSRRSATSTCARSICRRPQSGVNRPNAGVFRRTPLSAEYNIFDSERYVLTLDNRALRDAASAAPYEFIEILVNDRTYGGGGIFNDQATASVDSAFSPSTSSSTSSATISRRSPTSTTRPMSRTRPAAAEKPEPWEPNVTALHDPAQLKWRDLVDAGTPLPTPWDKEAFEKHTAAIQKRRARHPRAQCAGSEMDALFREQRAGTTKFLGVDEVLAARSARSKEPPTKREASTGRRPTASCSRGIRWASAACAAARSSGSSICIHDSCSCGPSQALIITISSRLPSAPSTTVSNDARIAKAVSHDETDPAADD